MFRGVSSSRVKPMIVLQYGYAPDEALKPLCFRQVSVSQFGRSCLKPAGIGYDRCPIG